jgi:hypothetical protein
VEVIDPKAWRDEGVIFRPTQPTEDFIVEGQYAMCVSGPSFQYMRLRMVTAPPRGPFPPIEEWGKFGDSEHTRLYRGKLSDNYRLVTAAWPHAGSLGIWCFRDHYWSTMAKTLLIPPAPPYGIVAGNPTVIEVGDEYHVVFEGRGADVRWHLYHAVFDEMPGPIKSVTPLGPGANPSLAQHGDEVLLYYSDPDFNVALKSQKLP